MSVSVNLIREELSKLKTDKGNISNAVVALKTQLEEAENRLVSIDGAIKTCEYFIALGERSESSPSEEPNSKKEEEGGQEGVNNG